MARISRVDAIPVAYPEPNDNNAERYLLFARIETTDGTVGWGEAITQWPESTKAAEVLLNGLAELLIGQDPEANVELWQRLRSRGWWYGYRGGLFNFALSAIDIALWDLRGKLSGKSLSTMIGRSPLVPEGGPIAMASTHVFRADLDAEVERHRGYVEAGYVGFKIGLGKKGDARVGYDVDRDLGFVADLRAASGPDAWIAMDRGQALPWTLDDATRRLEGWQEQGLKWVEEPFEPWEHSNFRKLRQSTRCLMAGAEREWDCRGYSEVIAEGVLDIYGCDVGRVGGVTEALRVIAAVETAGAWFNSHAWSSAVNTAASIALSASTARCLVQELKPEPNPMQDEIVEAPFRMVDGRVPVPTAPGLGVEVLEPVLLKYRF